MRVAGNTKQRKREWERERQMQRLHHVDKVVNRCIALNKLDFHPCDARALVVLISCAANFFWMIKSIILKITSIDLKDITLLLWLYIC
jgi:hypothetical protein